uniref:Uncharacterized protein n=1 Tax=Avena sativa TaxID=4498 RepID=A0ACD5WNW2_AVESA
MILRRTNTPISSSTSHTPAAPLHICSSHNRAPNPRSPSQRTSPSLSGFIASQLAHRPLDSAPLVSTGAAMEHGPMETASLKFDPMARLTDDILADIISRVPYKSTCCCKCVSTRWRDLISHPDYRKKMPQSLAGFFYESYNSGRSPRIARHFTNISGKGEPLIDSSLSFLPKYESIEVLDCRNGLLLCRCWKPTDPKTLDYMVCNPATKKWVVVPPTKWSSKAMVPRLGFDPAVSSHFHVFEFIDEEIIWGKDEEELYNYSKGIEELAIYSSKTGVWMHLSLGSSMFAIPMYSKGVFLNGVLHMSIFDTMVIAVDVEGSNWWTIDPPTTLYCRDGPGDAIFQSQGSLYFASSTAGPALSVWVLEDYTTENWTLKDHVSHLELFGTEYSFMADDFTIISIHPDRNLIFIVGGCRGNGHGRCCNRQRVVE